MYRSVALRCNLHNTSLLTIDVSPIARSVQTGTDVRPSSYDFSNGVRARVKSCATFEVKGRSEPTKSIVMLETKVDAK